MKVVRARSQSDILNRCLAAMLISYLPVLSACFDCNETLPQPFKFGSYQIDMKTPSVIHVGDKIVVSVNLPRFFHDSTSNVYLDIDEKVAIRLKLDLYYELVFDSNFNYVVPKTIYKEFNSYFDLKVLKGQSLNDPYDFECIMEKDRWVLELEYTPRQTGVFYFAALFMDLRTRQPVLPKGTCYEGDPQFDAVIFFDPSDNQIPDTWLFGFAVE
jgi:hypothetical protein